MSDKKIRAKQRAAERNESPIERIYAEDGVIIAVTKDGTRKMHTVREAAIKAQSISNHMAELVSIINSSSSSNISLVNQLKKGQTLVRQISDACREALKQKDTNSSKTKLFQNFISSKTADGKDIASLDTEDDVVQRYMLLCPTVDEADIRAVLRSSLAQPEKDALLNQAHISNMASRAPKVN
jgi:hypothetical protein